MDGRVVRAALRAAWPTPYDVELGRHEQGARSRRPSALERACTHVRAELRLVNALRPVEQPPARLRLCAPAR
jgi:hypothetical protein